LGDSPPDAFLPGQRTITSFQAEFEIDSPTTGFRITGTKSAENLTLLARCYELEGGIFPGTTQVRIVVPGGGDDPDAVNYEAKIETASATFADRGTSFVLLREISFSDGESSGELVEFSENFSSSLSQPEPIGLTKEQCNDGGYKRFGFKNQGDCVSFVETEGKNHPNSQKGHSPKFTGNAPNATHFFRLRACAHRERPSMESGHEMLDHLGSSLSFPSRRRMLVPAIPPYLK